jgi:hypothetical protein
MTTHKESHVFLHEDGYVEMVFVGMQDTEQLQTLIDQAQVIVNERGPMSLVVDGRNGRIQPNASNFSLMMSMGRFPNLVQLYILTTNEPGKEDAVQGPSVVTSILTSVLGFRPHYSKDEADVRRRAAADKKR